MKAVVSWSGGKDSCSALYKALQEGVEVSHLLHFVDSSERTHMSQGVSHELIASQAEALGIPLIQKMVQWKTYESGFQRAIDQLRPMGVDAVIFGDIEEDRANWSKKLCLQSGVTPN